MNKKSIIIVICFLLSLFLVVNLYGGEPRAKKFRPNIPQTWTQITPGSTTFMGRNLSPTCSGKPGTNPQFSFFAKGGPVNNLVVFFDGGGACWDTMNCIYFSTYSPVVDETAAGLAGAPGIFDLSNPNNPFKDWSFVFIPYCTADIHWGSNDQVYYDYLNKGFGPTTIHHRGFDNFLVVLKWMLENIPRPQNILVAGSSAGSYGALMGFPYIQEAYPGSKADMLGDAGFGVTSDYFHTVQINNWEIQQNLPAWIPGFENNFADFTIADMYKWIGAYYNHRKIGQFTYAWDATQAWFYNVMLNINPTLWGLTSCPPTTVWEDWHDQMLDFANNEAATPNYRYFITAGNVHTILGSSNFYTEQSAGVKFLDWIKAMVGNEGGTRGHGAMPWSNVMCENCNSPAPCN